MTQPQDSARTRGAPSWEDDGGARRRDRSSDCDQFFEAASVVPSDDPSEGRVGSDPGLGLAPLTAEESREMRRLGIERRPVDAYRIGDFRYTSLKDATAQALRRKAV